MRVNLVRGHGEFFDRGDPIPKHATLTVHGVEDPLVESLKLEELLSAALSERARRRNEQVTNKKTIIHEQQYQQYSSSVIVSSVGRQANHSR